MTNIPPEDTAAADIIADFAEGISVLFFIAMLLVWLAIGSGA